MGQESAGPAGRLGVVLLNMGGPWTLDDVRPFLLAVFNDRSVIRFPGGRALQGVWARLIAAVRSSKVRARYAEIGGGSPLLRWTRRQADGLAELLDGAVVEVAMRYSEPTADQALARLAAAGCEKVVALPLYPHDCDATTGSSLRDLERAQEQGSIPCELIKVRSFHDHPLYIDALVSRIRAGLKCFTEAVRPRVVVLFSAHGVPLRLHESGDPYVGQVERSVELVWGDLEAEASRHVLAFQSRAGPVRWIGPRTDEVLRELGAEGVRGVLVVPISFVSDHIETLHEIDVQFAEIARAVGVTEFVRAPSLNDERGFVEALQSVVVQALAGEEAAHV